MCFQHTSLKTPEISQTLMSLLIYIYVYVCVDKYIYRFLYADRPARNSFHQLEIFRHHCNDPWIYAVYIIHALKNVFFLQIDEHTLTDKRSQLGKDPFPIYTVTDKQSRQEEGGGLCLSERIKECY